MNRTALTTALTGLIGFRAGNIADATDNLGSLSTSSSGTYVDAHPLLSTDRIYKSCKPLLVEGADFAAWLTQRKADAMAATVTAIEGAMQAAGLMPLLARAASFLCESYNGQAVDKRELRKAGLALTPLQDDVLLTVSRIRVSLTLPTTVVLKLYEEFTTEVLATFTLQNTLVAQWHDVEFPVLEVGKRYWLLYEEDLLVADLLEVQALNTLINRPAPSAGCSGCVHKQLSEFLRVEGVTVDQFGRADIYTNNNFGLNLTVKAEGDTSERLLRQPLVLLPLYSAILEKMLLRQIAFSERHNGTADDDMQGAIFSLYGTDNKYALDQTDGKRLKELIDRLTADTNVVIKKSDDYFEWDSI